ncbi:MAG: type III pantothenate kinase [Gemmatimonadaceae bacterium]
MIVAFDVGNTETTIGVFAGDVMRANFRITTNSPRTVDETSVLLAALLDSGGIKIKSIDGAAICSVVPQLTATLAEACRRVTGSNPFFIDATADLPITLDVDEPLTVGADRIANTLAAHALLERDTIVVDLGTATTYDCITAEGSFFGGIIQPGVTSSAETLFSKTSKLPATAIVAPAKLIGTRTEECIQSGVVYGSAESIDGLVRRIKAEWPRESVPVVLATGGLAEVFASHCREFDQVDPFFTLKGVRIGFEFLSGARATE